ncbi:phytoene desaturase family protein [Brevibacillus brevis]|uniref:phytoene desaturase family protein n=1 Tax=Brevibacillus brevis TaxID=1393 RepID=UPI000D0FEE06|nr:FAD-dependent oxidoreductase [Brevibacillus brevis]PSJ68920.1 dehydrogenase [Brevibacillus brevis]RED29474.1 phytoene dehydrogenase-like protein [Brevibacillus brevis]GEC92021.1 dehydrogenase [Brevibacillus brevis]VEF88076.1 Protoporphyrinogen oxidase [Brevibacillus brevis]
MEKWDVAVIGGGMSGWVAAAYAVKAGQRVMLAEKARMFGGRALTVHKNGVFLSLGAHAIYRDGECFRILNELGATPDGNVPAMAGHMLREKQLYDLPGSPLSLMTSRLLSIRGKVELARMMMSLKKLDKRNLPQGSLKEWAERSIREPEVRHMIYALCRTATFAHRPEIQSAGPALRQVNHVLNGGALYVNGGWSSIIERLRQTAMKAGVRTETGKAVVSVTRQTSAQPDSVESFYEIRFADGEVRYANAVILAVPPTECYKIVSGSEKTALERWCRQARPVTTACLDLGMRRLPNPKVQFVMGLDSPFLFSNQSRAAKLSDNGELAVHILKYHGSSQPDAEQDKADLERMMDILQPGWRKELQATQYLPHITVVHDYAHTERMEAPGPAVPELPNLYIAGDWAGHGELLVDAAAASAKRAVVELLNRSMPKQGEYHEYRRTI